MLLASAALSLICSNAAAQPREDRRPLGPNDRTLSSTQKRSVLETATNWRDDDGPWFGDLECAQDGPEPSVNTTGREVELWAPLRHESFVLGELDFTLTREGDIRIKASDLVTLLQPILSPEGVAALDRAIGGRDFIDASRLEPHGFRVSFNNADFTLNVEIPPEARPRTTLRLATGRANLNGEFQTPARLSAYLNVRGSVDHVQSDFQSGFQQSQILFDFAARSHGVYMETEGSYFGEAEEPFRREGTRFVYDDEARTTRYTLGDLKPQGRGFVVLPPMSGVSVVKSARLLDPYRTVQPSGRRSFTLSRSSVVEAIVNGQFVQRFRLDPGVYNLDDLPVSAGENDIRLVIEDAAGQREELQFSVFFSQNILQAGESEYGLFAGVETPFEAGGRSYESDSYVVSGFYQRGLSPRITAGANFQAQSEGWLAGGEASFQTPAGLFGIQAAATERETGETGYAGYVSYSNGIDFTDDYSFGFSLAAETRSQDFAPPSVSVPLNRYQYDYSASASVTLPRNQYFSVSARQSAAYEGFEDEYSYRASYGLAISPRLGFRAEASRRSFAGQEEDGFAFELVYQLNDNSTVTASHDTTDARTRVAYDTSRGYGVGSWSAGADYSVADEGSAASGSFSQVLNRARWGVAHYEQLETTGGSTESRTSARLATALVYADGQFAISRPVVDAFVIARPHHSLESEVVLDPSEEGYTARSGILGPAVHPELGALAPRTITYDAPRAPEGYDLGTGSIRVRPSYRSGYLHTIGSDYSLSAIGQLVNQFGEPLTLVAGRAIELANPNRAPVVVFTNRDGRFGAYGLRPGVWRIEMPNGLTYTLDVPTDPDGIIRAGTLTPEPSQ
jgi:outer membrane usher protein